MAPEQLNTYEQTDRAKEVGESPKRRRWREERGDGDEAQAPREPSMLTETFASRTEFRCIQGVTVAVPAYAYLLGNIPNPLIISKKLAAHRWLGMITPLASTLVNVVFCLAGGVLFAVRLSEISKAILKKKA